MANFWFEIVGTEKYFSTDYSTRDYKKVQHTKEEYDAQDTVKGHTIYIDRDNEDLQRVDELICEFMGEPKPDRKFDSLFYHWCHEYGFLCLYKLGGGVVGDSPEHLPWLHAKMDEFIKNCLEHNEEQDEFYRKLQQEGYVARCHALIDWVFTKKWIYCATR